MQSDDVTPSPLSAPLKERLLAASLRSVQQLRPLRVGDLATRLRCSMEDAVSIRRELDAAFGWGASRSGAAATGITALAALQAEEAAGVQNVPTFCKELDDLLGGGVRLGAVTEFCACRREREGVGGWMQHLV